MDFSPIDLGIIIIYLLAVALIGSLSGGRQRSANDYFMGGKNVPWWAVSFSIVAAETSSLTFISIPGLAYLTNLNFLQLTFGYLIARIIVAQYFLPAYKTGQLSTAYTFLETRFGYFTRRYASIVFLFTRVAADGVRLFSTAIPLALIMRSVRFFAEWSNVEIYIISIIIITMVSFIYTFTGGVKGVIWADVLQISIYSVGAILAIWILLQNVSFDMSKNILEGKTEVFNFDLGRNLAEFFSNPYTFIGSLIGGIFLSMASHGTDQLIVQRLLTIKKLNDSKKAIITSGILVIIQFAMFLFVGLLLYLFFNGIELSHPEAPFNRADEIFPYFIIYYLPVGIRGIIIAGLFAAAISTLAGSISSLSSSSMLDLYKPLARQTGGEKHDLKISRIFTVFWALVLTFVAFIFIQVQQSVIEIALGIASITYGGLLGTFLLGLFFDRIKERAALVGFSAGILIMIFLIVLPMLFTGRTLIHWTWYVAIGTVVTIIVGNIFQRVSDYGKLKNTE